MKKYIYILFAAFAGISCEIDNVGPLLDDLDIIFFLADEVDVREDQSTDVLVELSSTKGGNSTQLTLGGTAVEGVDYTIAGGLEVTFAEGVYNTSIAISLIDNLNPEDDHTIVLSLPEGQGYSADNRREFTINIINNEVSGGTVVSAISTTNDDVEEGATGPIDFDSSDLELGEFDTGGTPDRGLQTIGLRFNNIGIPANATITSARIQFTTDTPGASPAEMTIYGENVGNSAAFADIDFNVSTRDRTTSNSVWSIPPWITEGDKAEAQQTSDLSAIVQEIVNMPYWSVENSISFIMIHTGVSEFVTDNDAGREAETIDGTDGGVDAPVLTIEWEI